MSQSDLLAEAGAARALLAHFTARGASAVEPGILMPADTLIDLYGEDLRARAYTCADSLRDAQMLRPDFTVGVAQAHIASGAESGRYAYAGPVFRQQDADPGRPSEYQQAGLEIFGGADPHLAEAEVFAAMVEITRPLGLRAVFGDIGLLTAAIDGLSTSTPRKAALLRHIWRPRRFRALLDRFAGRKAPPPARARLLENLENGADVFASAGPQIGLRSRAEISARIDRLQADAAEPPISERDVVLLEQLLALRDTAPAAAEQLRDIAVDLPAISPAVARFTARLDALAQHGIDLASLEFEASYGRTTLEYYDGFVFGLTVPGRPDLPAVVTGGRYDALTRVLGGGAPCPAVGAAIRVQVGRDLAAERGVQWP